jgi:hypothetical protein
VTLTVSPQIRLVALVGALAAAGLAVFMLTMRAPSSSVDAAALPKIKPLYGGRKVATHPTPAKTTAAVATTHAVAQPKPKPARPAPKPAVAANGLPVVLVAALEGHPVVVVALYDPQARIDGISLAEAQAGAAAAGAGFVPLDVLDASQAGPLMKQLGVLPDPAVLVYRRPANLVARFDGFADRDTVAQAVTNVTPGGLARQAASEPAAPPVVTRKAWATRASKLCTSAFANSPRLSATPSRAEYLHWAEGALAREQALVSKLSALSLPTSRGDRFLAKQLVDAATLAVANDRSLYVAMKHNDRAAIARILPAEARGVDRGNAAARAVGADGCAHFGE